MKQRDLEKKMEQFKRENAEPRRYDPAQDVHHAVDIKKPHYRLEKLFTKVSEDGDGRTIDRTYRDRKGVVYLYRKIYDNKTNKENTLWQILNARTLPVIPGMKL